MMLSVNQKIKKNQDKFMKKGEILFQHDNDEHCPFLIDTQLFTSKETMCYDSATTTNGIGKTDSTCCSSSSNDCTLKQVWMDKLQHKQRTKENIINNDKNEEGAATHQFASFAHDLLFHHIDDNINCFSNEHKKCQDKKSGDLTTLKRFFQKVSMNNYCNQHQYQQPNDLFLPSLIVSSIIFRELMSSNHHDSIYNIQKHSHGRNSLMMITTIIDFATNYFHENLSYMNNNYNDDNADEEEYETVLECWTILLRTFPIIPTIWTKCSSSNTNSSTSNDENHNYDDKTETSNSKSTIVHLLRKSPHAFNNIQKFIKRNCLVPVSIAVHPLHHFITNELLKLDDKDLFVVLDIIYNMAGVQKGEMDRKEEDEPTATLQFKNKTLLSSWRKAVYLVQAATSFDGNELKSILGTKLFQFIQSLRRNYVLFDTNLNLMHSCVPNCMVEVVVDDNDDDDNDDDNNHELKTNIVSLHDVRPRENLYMSKIANIDEGVNDRAMALRKFYGPSFLCHCPRCTLERHWDKRHDFNVQLLYEEGSLEESYDDNENSSCKDKITFHTSVLKNLGDLAMQHGRYDDACNIYNLCLKETIESKMLGDILHAKAASFLERGMFLKAQGMWMEAKSICPTHSEIRLQNLKQEAYGMNRNVISVVSPRQPFNFQIRQDSFQTIIPKLCFLTKENCPILSRKQCEQIIQWAETAAQEREEGWTTSRHYAVPTTDIPIHEIPPILEMFNTIFNQRLRPLLALQFGKDEVGKDGCDIYIHDAFVVRYDARKQRHLPLHRDQSTHSFTIALNDSSEYDGGGTYIAKRNLSIRPSLGGALSFRGDKLLHGGDPLIRGRRYIIVAFCYAVKGSTSITSIITRQAKRPRFDNKDSIHGDDRNQDVVNNQQGTFSFGFNL